MRTVLLAIGTVLVAAALGIGALYWVIKTQFDFILENRSGVVITDIELIDRGTTRRRLERLEPDQTVRLPLAGGEEGWTVEWSDAEGRWLALRSIYVDVLADAKVVFQPGHRVNNDTASETK